MIDQGQVLNHAVDVLLLLARAVVYSMLLYITSIFNYIWKVAKLNYLFQRLHFHHSRHSR